MRWRIHRGAVVSLLVGIAAVGSIAWAAWVAHDNNESRLLTQRTREAAAVLGNAVPAIEVPLASAAALADATGGDAAAFRQAMGPRVRQGQFESVSLWPLGSTDPEPTVVVGSPPALSSSPVEDRREELGRAVGASSLIVVNLLDRADPRLGYATTAADSPSFVVYAETALPTDRTNEVQPGSAFDGLEYALYLGDREDSTDLLLTSVADPPIRGRRHEETVPFGSDSLLLVMTPDGSLGGPLMRVLPWIVVAMGAVLVPATVVGTERLIRRRLEAESLSRQNRELYDRQRDIAQTLQRSLLPERLPAVDGLEAAARYQPGVAGIEIGGDWYDLVHVDDDRLVLVVGDVAGRGLPAAATMASLRFATHAYAMEGHPAAAILTMLGSLLDVGTDGTFATVLCADIDARRRTVTIASAGHPSPVLVDHDGARLVATPVGVPVGVGRQASYETVTVGMDPGASLVAFTDGLFERRGESVDVGLERVRAVAAANGGSTVQELVDRLTEELATGVDDDTVLLGVRWR
jgi:hypothetical protein